MCELFSISSGKNTSINDYLRIFYSHCNDHPHGWGFANFKSDSIDIYKEPVKADSSSQLKNLLSNPIIVKDAFAHIRLATVGKMDNFNCHPFVISDNNNRRWTLMHNGTVFEYDALDRYLSVQEGQTDSERILLYIIDEVNRLEEEKTLSQKQLFNLINSIITDLSKDNKLNIMIYDGNMMYIHINLKDSLYCLNVDDSLIFATTPLSDDEWKKVDINTLYAVCDGRIIYKGLKHENEFIFTHKHLDYFINNLSVSQREDILREYGSLNNFRKMVFENPH